MTAFPPIILVIFIFVLFWKCDTYCVILYLGLVTTRRSTIREDITGFEEILIGSVWLMIINIIPKFKNAALSVYNNMDSPTALW